MKLSLYALLLGCLFYGACQTTTANHATNIIAEDIPRFWKAYDLIVQTQDSVQQLALLEEHYLSKATPGLMAMIEARNYTAREFLKVITSYPKYWASIRSNTCLLYTSPSPRDQRGSRMPSSA